MMKLAAAAKKLDNIPEETTSEMLRTVGSSTCQRCGTPVSQIASVTTSEAVLTQVPSEMAVTPLPTMLEKIGGILDDVEMESMEPMEPEELEPMHNLRTNSDGLLTIVPSVPSLLLKVGGILEASEASELASTPTKGGFYQLGSDPTVPPNTSESYIATTPSEIAATSMMMCLCFNCWKAAGGKTWKEETASSTPTISPLPTNRITDIIPQTPTDELATIATGSDSDSSFPSAAYRSMTTLASEASESTISTIVIDSEKLLLREKCRLQAEIIAKLLRLSEVSERLHGFRRLDEEEDA